MEVSFAEGKMLEIVNGKSFYFECPGFEPVFLKWVDLSEEQQQAFMECAARIEAIFDGMKDKHFPGLAERFKELVGPDGDY